MLPIKKLCFTCGAVALDWRTVLVLALLLAGAGFFLGLETVMSLAVLGFFLAVYRWMLSQGDDKPHAHA